MARTTSLFFLSLILGVFFVLVGTLKLTPAISSDIHKEMKATFKRARTVFPFSETTGFRPKTSTYRKTTGTLEVVCGLVLMFVPGLLKEIANVVLLCLMFGALYTHWALEDQWHAMTGSLVFGLLLTCRLVINLQHRMDPEEPPSPSSADQKKKD